MRRLRFVALSAGSLLALGGLPTLTGPASVATVAGHINFQPAGALVPSGYSVDSGAAFDGRTGWQSAAGTPLDLTANTRDRNSASSPDQRYDTFIHTQAPAGSGNATPGMWQYAVDSGTYDVTVAVGEPSAVDSVDDVVAEPGTPNVVPIISHFVPTASQHWLTVTKRVSVTDGFLTLDPTGGSNTKLDFVDVVPVVAGPPTVAVSAPDDALLGLGRSRLVFSTVSSAGTPTQLFTFKNTGGGTLTISGLAIGGPDSTSFALAAGQPTSLSIAGGQSATVGIRFTPTANTFCATAADQISTSERYASLTFSTNDAASATGSTDLAGINDCGNEGANEPVLDQIAKSLGYTTVTASGTTPALRRGLGPLRTLPGSDEVQAPYFQVADPAQVVQLVPAAHYSGRTLSTFGRTGWYAKGAAVATPCSSTCNQLFAFPADQPAPGAYVQNQKLLPSATGTTSFRPTGPFGFYNGDGSDVNFTDDAKNIEHTTAGADISPPHYGHGLRAFPAYGPGHVLIPDTWLLATDVTRVPAYKNNDFNDVVFIAKNVKLDVGVAPAPGSAGLQHDFTTGGTVGAGCVVTGFDGVLPNTAGTQCNASNVSFTAAGLSLTSTPGEMGNATNSQQNALYDSVDASRGSFTVTSRVKGPLTNLASNYQQVAGFFGPDQDNYVKVEAEHNSLGTDPHLTMFFEQGGVGSSPGTVSLPALTTANTVDLIIKGNTSVPDGVPPNTDTYKVRGWPIDQVSVYYSINGATPVQVGTAQRPADVMRWFSTSAKAGILVSGGGATAPITATFSRLRITTP